MWFCFYFFVFDLRFVEFAYITYAHIVYKNSAVKMVLEDVSLGGPCMEMCRQRFQKERNKMVLKGVVSPPDGLLADIPL